MPEDLRHVETAIYALTSQTKSLDQWIDDVMMALGTSGKSNQLGYDLVNYLAKPRRETAERIVNNLAISYNETALSAFIQWAQNKPAGENEVKAYEAITSALEAIDDKLEELGCPERVPEKEYVITFFDHGTNTDPDGRY